MPLDADDALVPPPSFAPEFDATAAPAGEPEQPAAEPQEPTEAAEAQEAPPVSDPDAEEAPPAEFDPRYKQPFVGLLYVGQLEDHFELFGHHFHIATPSRAEKIQMGLAIKPYQDTVSAEIAWQTAMVAAYLLKVDDIDLPEPVLTTTKETAFSERFKWVSENLRDVVIDEVFTKCLELDGKVRGVVDAMGKASG